VELKMELTNDERMTLYRGLDKLIDEKEFEITQIDEKTVDDYHIRKRILDAHGSKPFNLEVAKERDIQKARTEITKLRDLSNKINNGENRILTIPRFIHLNLSDRGY
jgi:hypothetical protein